MKPKIGDTVYTIYRDQIYKETVGYLGAESFIVEYYACADDFEYNYDDYGTVWFKSLEKAMKQLRKNYGRKKKIEQVTNDCWQIYEEDD